ncbi:ATP-binding protein [Streptomyces sp. NPDC018347]|uniref:ATP-binding protein n=1 Tax=Streptomyces sp. NPDC018347 TaxID=3157193 RepID=UPI0033EDBECD
MNAEPPGENATVRTGEVPGMTVALDGDGACVARARPRAASFLARTAGERGIAITDRVVGLSRLVVGEPVTNAGKCAPGPVRMVVRVAESAAETEVRGSAPALPAPEPADPRRVGRHGLEIVRAAARGFAVRGDGGGKRVIARIPLTGDQDAA